MRPPLRTNLAANFVGAGWTAALQIACVPAFIHLLGVEAYGLIGFFVTLQVTTRIVDLGFGATVSRELARNSSSPNKDTETRDFLRTVEAGYWGLALVAGFAIALLAPVLAKHWLTTSALDVVTVERALVLMGMIVALQLPLSFYQGGLTGLQRLVSLNVLRVVAASASLGGAVLVLWLVSATVEAFFIWQLLTSLAHVIAIALLLRRSSPTVERRPRFDLRLLRAAWPFAKGMSGIVIVGTLLSQMDKIVLSNLLPLADFGYYTAAGMVAASLQLFVTPIFSAVFPRLSALVASGDQDAIRRLYHAASQLMAVCVLPTAIAISMWAPQAIELWTGASDVAGRVAPIAILLLAGAALNALMHVPHALQLAYGWTSLNLRFSVCAVVAFAPLLVAAALRYGAVGGAATWAVFNICYVLVVPALMHRRLLSGELMRWWIRDLGYPLLAALATVTAVRVLTSADATGAAAALQLVCAGTVAVVAAALVAPAVRTTVAARGLRGVLT